MTDTLSVPGKKAFVGGSAPLALAMAILLLPVAGPSHAAPAPEIRTSERNPVPACVTPDRLMAFLKSRNGRLDPRFADIATHYKTFGEAWRVRWDYAFFQMAIETNFLTYRAPSGRMGDVDPRQNNFAGIGTTGGGVPGDRFPDVKTGVHAQIQHLVVYSGERLAAPIAPRTQLKQDHILVESLKLERPVRFGDLARRWAVDRNYDKSIEWVADSYRSRYCRGREAAAAPGAITAPAPNPAPKLTAAPKPATPPRHPAVRTVWVRSEPGKPVAATVPKAAPVPAPKKPAVLAGDVPPPAEQKTAKRPEHVATQAALVPTADQFAPVVNASEPDAAESPAAEPLAGPASAEPAVLAMAPQASPSFGSTFDPGKTPPSRLGAGELSCSIGTASYGGSKSVLIKSQEGDAIRYTALTVLEGFEASMTDSFIKARAPRGMAIGHFDSRDAALGQARSLCPQG
ncbi:MAG: hypothetical protein ACT4N2_14205 [Hyphomicrobium sp.]